MPRKRTRVAVIGRPVGAIIAAIMAHPELVIAEPECNGPDSLKLTTNGLWDLRDVGFVVPPSQAYGPPRKGKRGKPLRW